MIRYYQTEGFRVGEAKCRQCHFTWLAIIHPDQVAWKLDCASCHARDNWFTELQPLNAK